MAASPDDIAFQQFLEQQKFLDRQLKSTLLSASEEAYGLVSTLPDETFSQRVRIAQYQQKGRQIGSVLDEMWDEQQSIEQVALFSSADIAADANRFLLAELGQGFESALFDSFAIANDQVLANVESRLLDDIPLSERVYKNKALSSGQVDGIVNNGISLGKSAREIAREVHQFISPNTPGGVSFASMRLARTEINNAFHTTQTRSYAKQPWIKGVKWHISGSHPRPDTCDQYAKDDHDDLGPGVFRPNNVPGKPHPQCLCHITAITIPRDEFLDNLVAGKYDSYAKDGGYERRGGLYARTSGGMPTYGDYSRAIRSGTERELLESLSGRDLSNAKRRIDELKKAGIKRDTTITKKLAPKPRLQTPKPSPTAIRMPSKPLVPASTNSGKGAINSISGKSGPRVDSALGELSSKFPRGMSNLQAVRPGELPDGVMAQYFPDRRTIVVNGDYARNLSKWEKTVHADHKYGHLVSNTPEEIIYHEAGHHLYLQLNSSDRLALDVQLRTVKFNPENHLSEYATANKDEYISEALASYMKKDGNPAGEVVGKFFERKFG